MSNPTLQKGDYVAGGPEVWSITDLTSTTGLNEELVRRSKPQHVEVAVSVRLFGWAPFHNWSN